ncbi:ribosomal RNA processing 47 [Brevipalpus obovatus]|uniref:ribosomal RNA processing 47 n=1 Tax=Brevipalpus obovatus TaxID=246614 RepID=UPI003D9DED46
MDLPNNLIAPCNQFRAKMSQLKNACNEFLQNLDHLREKAKGNPAEEAQLDLTLTFTLNSLFWIYLICNGIDPRKHKIKEEITRIKNSMVRLNEIKNPPIKPKVDKEAVGRFVRGALFDPNDKSKKSGARNDAYHYTRPNTDIRTPSKRRKF